jgi:hypothetical protein
MPWRCPACQEQIRHSEIEAEPRFGVVYRCHVCRLELVRDRISGKLDVPGFETAEDERPATAIVMTPKGATVKRKRAGNRKK